MPGRGVRAVIVAFLVALMVSGTGALEFWPLTDWRLFAGLRRATEPGWVAVAVDDGGRESRVALTAISRHHTGALQLMQRFGRLPATEQRAVCAVWLDAVADEREDDVVALRLYRTTVATRSGEVRSRSLEHTCTAGGE